MRKRNHRIVFYLNDEEFDRFDTLVKQSGWPREVVIRTALDGKRLNQLPPIDYGKLIFEIRRVSQNLNRLLRLAYANHYSNTQEIKACLEKIRSVTGEIHEAFFLEKPELAKQD